jgi:hypothetical protein
MGKPKVKKGQKSQSTKRPKQSIRRWRKEGTEEKVIQSSKSDCTFFQINEIQKQEGRETIKETKRK